jgi:hypothetical protein
MRFFYLWGVPTCVQVVNAFWCGCFRSPDILDSIYLGELHLGFKDRGQVSVHVMNVTCANLNPLDFILHYKTAFHCGRLDCEAKAGFLSVANTAVSSSMVNL